MKKIVAALSGTVLALSAWAAPTPAPSNTDSTPLYRVVVVGKVTPAVSYSKRGSTKIDFRGTPLLAKAEGEATVKNHDGVNTIDVELQGLAPATQYGNEYLTFVLWAVTPEGRAKNLGEVVPDHGKAELTVTTDLQAFAMIVTAEPYFAVTQPSELVVLENVLREGTRGHVDVVDAKYELLKRGVYVLDSSRPRPDEKVPSDLLQAWNAVVLSHVAGADTYAAETQQKAVALYEQANADYEKGRSRKTVSLTARQAVQTAEDARLIAVERAEQGALSAERQASADREARAKADAEMESQRRAAAEADRRNEEARRTQAEAQAAQANAARDEAERTRAAAQAQAAQADIARDEAERNRQQAELAAQEAARLKAEAEADRNAAAAESEAALAKAEEEKAAMRSQLQRQLNVILETRDSARGLIINMSDVVFDTGRATLKPGAREKLAKIAGVLLTHPDLKLEVDGHTDSVGGDDYNQKLSESRAAAVRDFLVQQGVSSSSITAIGFGKTQPVASNDNAAGRQLNRRVEVVVSGESITTTASVR
jgi:outer membrane protein OmpA-like peptidoglycan-associated protein